MLQIVTEIELFYPSQLFTSFGVPEASNGEVALASSLFIN
jgi:hypothetical protein